MCWSKACKPLQQLTWLAVFWTSSSPRGPQGVLFFFAQIQSGLPTFNRALCVWMTFWFLHTHTQTLTRQTWPSAKWRMPPGPVSVYSTTSSARDLEVRYLILHRPTPQGFGTKNMKCVIENKLILLTKYKYSSIQQMYKNKAFAELTNATCQLCYI